MAVETVPPETLMMGLVPLPNHMLIHSSGEDLFIVVVEGFILPFMVGLLS
jgi:hypothetical protein